jgi:uncharacterized OB-fold protein
MKGVRFVKARGEKSALAKIKLVRKPGNKLGQKYCPPGSNCTTCKSDHYH